MRFARFAASTFFCAAAVAFLLCVFHPNAAGAKDPPSDVCTLLSPEQLQKTLALSFGPAEKATAPPAYRGQPEGTNCHFKDKSGRRDVTLIVYVDRSPAEAKQTFDQLSAWYPATSKPSGIGDSAYIDKSHAIHVLKGSARYFIQVTGAAAVAEKQAQELATAVAAQL